MAPSLKSLFENHLGDLKDINPAAEDIFICPICYGGYRCSDIQDEKLTRGDVWPKYIREKSKITRQHIVLLCKKCNSLAGQFGDAQAQLMEQIKDSDKTGILFGKRRITLQNENDESIKIRNVTINKDSQGMSISGKLDKNLNWIGNNPTDQKRFEQLIGNTKPVNINIDIIPANTVSPKPELAPAGWITSAYLFAFYTFGYKYIFQPELEPVRKYIFSSLDEKNQPSLKVEAETFDLREYKEKYYPDPEMDLIVPVDGRSSVRLEINFLRYQVKLPFQYVPSVLKNFIYSRMPDIDKKIPELQAAGEFLYFSIRHAKRANTITVLDYLLGKPVLSS